MLKTPFHLIQANHLMEILMGSGDNSDNCPAISTRISRILIMMPQEMFVMR